MAKSLFTLTVKYVRHAVKKCFRFIHEFAFLEQF
jgi:hypothetical protein